MSRARQVLLGVMSLAIAASAAAPAGATTLIRVGLDTLVAGTRAVILGEVVDATSYWNADRTFILTDVRIAVHEVFKGERSDQELTITIMGGQVGDLTTLVVGGPELIPGSSYILFLDEERLPGLERALTVRHLCQGVFDLRIGRDGLRAVSQAKGQLLLPDRDGFLDAPGGEEGLPLSAMTQSIRKAVDRQRIRKEAQ